MSSRTGILLIDKATGMTSHDVVAIVRKKLSAKGRPVSGWKVGHAGTLDPLATGLLIILVGREFTKRQAEFMNSEKEYICRARLGIETDTYDIDGKIIKEVAWEKVNNCIGEQVNKLLSKFRGKIKQCVPAFSAVKVRGQKLYEKARKGEVKKSELPVRVVEIKELELVSFDTDDKNKKAFFKLRIVCSKGTYIRSLIHDMGQELGVGATVIELRRIRSGELSVKDAVLVSNI
ncbi:MAG: tRNA pseudouridine(55) synthase TruB [Patescibacteria group bacterium]